MWLNSFAMQGWVWRQWRLTLVAHYGMVRQVSLCRNDKSGAGSRQTPTEHHVQETNYRTIWKLPIIIIRRVAQQWTMSQHLAITHALSTPTESTSVYKHTNVLNLGHFAVEKIFAIIKNSSILLTIFSYSAGMYVTYFKLSGRTTFCKQQKVYFSLQPYNKFVAGRRGCNLGVQGQGRQYLWGRT